MATVTQGVGLLWIWAAIVAAAAALAAGLIVLLHPLLVRYALARPNARSSHQHPTPQGGGVAVVLAALATICGVALVTGSVPALLPSLFAATLLLALCGGVDDIRAIAVIPRLLLQGLAVLIVVATVPVDVRIFDWLPLWVERTLLVVAGLWFINLVNFMDGIDWMTVAEVLPLTLALAIIGLLGELPPEAVVVALALFGATLGFAPFNRPVARLFLGDVGSLPIGLLLGWLLMLVATAGHIAAALLLPLYYLADATVTLLRRIGNGEEIWQAHRTHFYQRATANGFTVMSVVSRVFLVNLGLAALAIATVIVPGTVFDTLGFFAGCIVVSILLMSFARHERATSRSPQPQSKKP